MSTWMTSSSWDDPCGGEAHCVGPSSSRVHNKFDQFGACPSQDLVIIGGRLQTDLGMVFLPPKRVETLLHCICTFLRVSQYKPAHQFLLLLGLMASCLSVVWLSRLYIRPIQWRVKDRWAPPLSLQAPIMVTRALTSDFQWWMHQPNPERGLKRQPQSQS